MTTHFMEHLFPLHKTNRRIFIKGVGFVSASLLLGTLGGCEDLEESIRNRPTRRRLRTGSAAVAADIATYREAVRLMKERSAQNSADKRGWTFQAAIHGTAGVGFNHCEHGTNHFFSWHRAYLFAFEKICQKLTGNNKFGLPYWNWNQNKVVHPDYLVTSSPLFSPRTRTDVSGEEAISTALLDPIFADNNFFTFSSSIEGTPHNNIHTYVGNIFGGFGSARDPLFWNHHCMVDYCWDKWNVEMGNDNTSDATWIGTSWDHFIDADGDPQTITAGVTTLMTLLSYQYESSAIGSHPAKIIIKTNADFKKVETRLRKGADYKFDIRERISIVDTARISIARPFSKQLEAAPSTFQRIIESDSAHERIFAHIQYASLPPTSDFFVRVFINLPEANASTPITDPHFAGTFAFFGTDTGDQQRGDGHRHQPRFLVNVTNALQKLRSAQLLKNDEAISVQLVAVPFGQQFEKADTFVQLNKIELIVTPVIVRAQQPQ
jgi:tyrosinase